MDIYFLELSDHLESPVEPYLTYFTDERREAILRYRFPSDRNRTVWAELLARWLIGRETGQTAEDVSIMRDERGKPYCGEGLHFSLSHSGPWVACSLGTEPNGVDVEMDRRIRLDIARHFFLPEEYETLKALSLQGTKAPQGLSPSGWQRAFLCYWTLKESCLKYQGTGLSGDMRTVDCAALLRGEGPLRGRNFDLPGGAVAGVVSTEALPACFALLRLRAEGQLFSFTPLK
ncbi:MAG: 4'-phosphopantetheinyl transferase superfamily protein [Fretibacterium sp.]|nr:4'-phosphopantetheinyl transferase superfamily protein [Fretibacterium sp.]